jgi:hypothetical protein
MVDSRHRRKMTVDEILNTDHYRSIIVLTDIFGNNISLRQAHYRWALMNNHGNIKSPLIYRQIEGFFNKNSEIYRRSGYSNRLEIEYTDGNIIRNCISSNSNLSNFLKRLSFEPYKILEKKKRGDTPYYILTNFGREQAKRYMLKRYIDGVPENWLKDIDKAIDNVIKYKIKKATSRENK